MRLFLLLIVYTLGAQIKSNMASPGTIPYRNQFGAATIFDNGAQLLNVKGFGAVGSGYVDDGPQIRTTIANLGNYGGIAFLPVGDFLISSVDPNSPTGLNCGIVIGNGVNDPFGSGTGTYSNINNITLRGSGYGSDAAVTGSSYAIRGATRLIAGGSVQRLVCTKGPVLGIHIENIHFDGASIATNGIYLLHTGSSVVENVSFRRLNGFSIDNATTSLSVNFYNCGNVMRNINFSEMGPQGGGVNLDSQGGVGSTCSTLIQNLNGIVGGGGRGAGVRAAMADNNIVQLANLSNYSSCCLITAAANNGSGVIRITINLSIATWFANDDVLEIHGQNGCAGMAPLGTAGNNFGAWVVTNVNTGTNQMDLVGSNASGCSYTGGSVIFGGAPIRLKTSSGNFPYGNVFYHIGSNYSNTINGTGSAGLTNYLFDSNAERALMQYFPVVNNIFGGEDNGNLFAAMMGQGQKAFRGIAGVTEIFSLSRGDGTNNVNGLDINTFDRVRIVGESLRVSSPKTLVSMSALENGEVVYCSNCTHGSNPCTSGGTGAIAKRLNGTWVCN